MAATPPFEAQQARPRFTPTGPATEPTSTTATEGPGAPSTLPPVELAPPAVTEQPWRLGRTDVVVVDAGRPTVAVPGVTEAAPARTIPTVVVHPSDGGGDREPVPADPAPGPFPLVVLSHGLTGRAEDLLPLMARIAEAGYVVASPDFPETTGGVDGLAALDRFVDQPGDVRAVVDELLSHPTLGAVIDPGPIGVGGHSLGGLTSYGIGYHPCCRDERVGAVFGLAGAVLPYPGGDYDWSGPPLLLVHGDEDEVVPYAASREVFGSAGTDAYLLTLTGEDHSSGTVPDDRGHEATAAAIVAFLDRWLLGDLRADVALDSLPLGGGVGTLERR